MHQNNQSKIEEDSGATPAHCCQSCSYLAGMVGIGLGARCKHPGNKAAEWIRNSDRLNLIKRIGPMIPGRSFCCKHYSLKTKGE